MKKTLIPEEIEFYFSIGNRFAAEATNKGAEELRNKIIELVREHSEIYQRLAPAQPGTGIWQSSSQLFPPVNGLSAPLPVDKKESDAAEERHDALYPL